MMLEACAIFDVNVAMDGVEVFMDMDVIEDMVMRDVGLALLLDSVLEELTMTATEVD